jgi:hypothetical protein
LHYLFPIITSFIDSISLSSCSTHIPHVFPMAGNPRMLCCHRPIWSALWSWLRSTAPNPLFISVVCALSHDRETKICGCFFFRLGGCH